MGAGEGRRRDYRAKSKRAKAGADGRRTALIRFADIELDIDAGEFRRAGKRVAIARKPFSMLCYLAANSERAVPKQELLRRLWPKVVVSDAAFASALKDLRRALGDESARPRFVSTVRDRGVRFIAELAKAGATRRPQTAALPGPAAPPLQTLFVGRLRELRALSRAAEAASRGQPKLVVISGAAGAGKTRLVQELLRDPSSIDFAIGWGACHPEEPAPYHPFAEAFRNRLAQSDGAVGPPGPAEVEFHQLLNPGRIGPSANRDEPASGRQEEAELFTAIWRVLERLARERPTLLVIEDLHHASASTLELLASLAIETSDAQHGDGLPLLVVVTTQPAEPGSRLELALQRIGRQRGTSSIEVAGLGARATGQLLAGVGAAPPTGSAAKAVHEAASGNPYLVKLLARERGLVSKPGGAAAAAMRAPIERRLERLSRETRGLLTVAAFSGEEFGPLMLCAATGLPPKEISAALDEAAEVGLVLGGPRTFRFDHELVRTSIRDATPEATRAEIHLTLAGVLEELYSQSGREHASEIARHLLLAGGRADPARVAAFARRAGDQAFALCAWHEAAEFYEAALGSESNLASAERGEIHLRAGLASSRDLQVQRAYDHFAAAAREFRAVGDDSGFAGALMYAARARTSIAPAAALDGSDLQRLQILYESLAEGLPEVRGRMLVSLSAASRYCRDDEASEEFGEQALTVGRNLEDDALCYLASEQIALARYSRLRLRESLAAWLDADAYARRSRDPWLRSLAGPKLAYALQQLGRLAEARTAVVEAEARSRDARNRAGLALVLAERGSLELLTGNMSAAEARGREALATFELTSDGWAVVMANVVRACTACHLGRWADAEAALSEITRPDHPQVGDGFFGPVSAAALRLLLIAHRAPQSVDRAELSSLVRRALAAGVRGPTLTAHTRLVEVALLLGATEQSRALEESLRLAEEKGFVFVGPRAVLLPRLQAGCALLDGRLDEAESYFGKALERARMSGARIELATTLIERAQMQARHGRPGRDLDRARADVAEARAIAREVGLDLLAERAAAVTRELASRRR